MPKVTFTKDFVWSPRRNVRIVYESGKTYGITSTCHAEAVKAEALPKASGGIVGTNPRTLIVDDVRR